MQQCGTKLPMRKTMRHKLFEQKKGAGTSPTPFDELWRAGYLKKPS